MCGFVRACAYRNSKIHAVKWETADLITSAVLHHSHCRLLFGQKRAGRLWCMSGVSGLERCELVKGLSVFRYFRTLFSFTRKASTGKTTRQSFNRSTNEISATEISPTQMGIALFRDFDQSVKKRSSFEKSQRFQSVQKRCSKNVSNVQKKCSFGSSKNVPNVQKKCSFGSSKNVHTVLKDGVYRRKVREISG